jgi:hypothetical protein
MRKVRSESVLPRRKVRSEGVLPSTKLRSEVFTEEES